MAPGLKLVTLNAILATLALVGPASSLADPPLCGMVHNDPLLGPNKPAPILLESKDKSVLIRFLADLKYSITKYAPYMPLTVQRAQVERTPMNQTSKLTLFADCAIFSFHFETNNGTYEVSSIEIGLSQPLYSISSCQILKPGIKFGAGEYYDCQKGSYQCVFKPDDEAINMVTLNIGDLVVQLDRPASAKDGEFSGKRLAC